jgi:hypothetical protein
METIQYFQLAEHREVGSSNLQAQSIFKTDSILQAQITTFLHMDTLQLETSDTGPLEVEDSGTGVTITLSHIQHNYFTDNQQEG